MKPMRWIPAVIVALLAAACDSSTAPEADAVISGEVEQTSEASSSYGPASEPSYSVLTGGGSSMTASTVVAASVRSDGSLREIAQAEVDADGRYSISGVPVGRTDLIISARSSSGAEVGRVIVRERTRSAGEVRAAPITSGTTAEGLVYARLRASGMAQSDINTGELALFLRLSESTAAHVAASDDAIAALSAAYASAQAAMTAALTSAGSGTSVSARAAILSDAAVRHDRDRNGGTGPGAARDTFVEAALDAYLAAGISAEALSLATAAAAAGLDKVLVDADAAARLEVAKEATHVGIRARQRLAAELPASYSPFRILALNGHTSLRVRIGSEVQFGSFVSAVREEEEAAEAAVFDAIMLLFSTLSADARAEIAARLENAFLEATLSARLDASASASQKGEAIAQYRQDVRAAVDAFVDSLPSGASLNADATVRLLVAIRGGPSFS